MMWTLFALLALSADDLHGDPRPPGALARLGTLRFRHAGMHSARIAFSADGKTLVAGGWANFVLSWDTRTGQPKHELRLGRFHGRAFAHSPDGSLVAVGGSLSDPADKWTAGIRLIELATGKVRLTLKRDQFHDGTLAFSPDGNHLASGGPDGVVRIEEVATGTELLREKFRFRSPPLTFSSAGVLAVSNYPSVFVWDWTAGKPPREIKMPGRGAPSVSFSPDGARLATGADSDAGVRLWDAASGKLLRTFRVSADDDRCEAAFSPDGKMLAATSYRAGGVVFWDPATGEELRRVKVGGQGRLESLVWAPDSRRLAVWGDGGAHLLDATTGKETPTPVGHRCHPGSVALLSDGTAMTAGDDGTVRLWDAATGKHRRVLRVSDGWVRGAAVSPDGRWVVTSTVSGDNAVSLWELKTGRLVYRLPGHGLSGGHRVVAFSPDSRQFHSWGDDRFLRTWAVRNGKAMADWELRADGEKPPDPDEPNSPDHFFRFGAATFSRDGKSLVLAGRDGFFVFDVKTGEQVRKISRDQGVISGVAISPDGKLLLAGSWGRTRRVTNPDGSMGTTTSDATVSLHDLTTGKLVHEQKHARSSIGPVAFSPDGKSFAAAAHEDAISFHDAATGAVRGTIQKVPSRVWSLAYSPDGKRVIVGGDDTTALIYPAPTKEKPR